MIGRAGTWVGALLLAGCLGDGGPASIDDGPPTLDVSARPPELLSETRLLEFDPATEQLRYNARVEPYELNTPLFSDYSLKARAIYVPDESTIAYDPETTFAFPVGAAIVKTFYYPADMREPDADLRLIETRLLMRTAEGWEAWPYVWNEEQTDAELVVSGRAVPVTFVDEAGGTRSFVHLVPQRNQCRSCHERNVGPAGESALTIIGPAARHLNRDFAYADGSRNQLEHLEARGMLSGLPAADEIPSSFAFDEVEARGPETLSGDDLDAAARSYLDVNCAHCHDPQGTQGVTSQLFLNHDNDDAFHLGVCKRPGSAGEGTGGLDYDIVPGDPDASILLFRVETTEVGAMMPLLGRSLQHAEGAALLRRWIGEMEPVDCSM